MYLYIGQFVLETCYVVLHKSKLFSFQRIRRLAKIENYFAGVLLKSSDFQVAGSCSVQLMNSVFQYMYI
jgi:hypothetical protein